jgi:hypothetical protein
MGFAAVAILAVGLSLGITADLRPSRPAAVADTVAGQRPSRLAVVAETVTIDSNIGETFAPAPQDAAPKLTAEQAFAQQRRRNGRGASPIPAGVTVKLGLLTILAGPANPHTGHVVTKDGIAYAALNELAWGYSWHWCPMSRNPLRPGRVRGPCARWNFLDVNTGREINENWQQ